MHHDIGGSGTISYQWKRCEIVVGTSSTYIVQTSDVGATITVTVTRSSNSGNVISNVTATITSGYSITFNSNGGSAVTIQNIFHGSTATRPDNPTRSGYVFDNWYSDSGLTTVYNFSTSVTFYITLYAKWLVWNFTNNVVEMVQIPTGTLTLGFATMTLSAFKMGKYEITQEQYFSVMREIPSYFNGASDRQAIAGEEQGKRPVENVTWYDAIEFCNKLSETEGLTPVYTITGRIPATGYPITSALVTADWSNDGYRLPTLAQWEYACRTGTTTTWHFGNSESELTNYAWYSSNSNGMTHQVGKKLPNAFGLYDMHGNVWEWCWDWVWTYPLTDEGLTYHQTDQPDPTGAESGIYRLGYGGCWEDWYFNVSSSSSGGNPTSVRNNAFGFRVVRP